MKLELKHITAQFRKNRVQSLLIFWTYNLKWLPEAFSFSIVSEAEMLDKA